jgi:hydrogenase-4 transcriptional activator
VRAERKDVMGCVRSGSKGLRRTDGVPTTRPAPLDMAMKQHIEAALTRGRVEGPHGAARLLDINPYTLRGRMRKLGINWHTFRAVP